MNISKLKYFVFLLIVFFKSGDCGEFGIGIASPNIGYKITLIGPKHMLDYSESYSSFAFAFDGYTPDRVVNRTLFFHFITGAKTEKWSPIIGIGGMYISYVKEFDVGNEEGNVFALGVALGTYHRIIPNLSFGWEINLGYPISSNLTKNNPSEEISLIPFVPKIGVVYLIDY